MGVALGHRPQRIGCEPLDDLAVSARIDRECEPAEIEHEQRRNAGEPARGCLERAAERKTAAVRGCSGAGCSLGLAVELRGQVADCTVWRTVVS